MKRKQRRKKQKKKLRKRKKRNPYAKYGLWDLKIIQYHKGVMNNNNREPNPTKCFYLKYNAKTINIGGFIDFITPTIINDLIINEG